MGYSSSHITAIKVITVLPCGRLAYIALFLFDFGHLSIVVVHHVVAVTALVRFQQMAFAFSFSSLLISFSFFLFFQLRPIMKGKVIAITGAVSGFGHALSKRLAKKGYPFTKYVF